MLTAYSNRISTDVISIDSLDPDITSLGGDWLSLIDIYELSDSYGCPVEPACPSGGITFDQESGVIDATDLNSECRLDLNCLEFTFCREEKYLQLNFINMLSP